MANLYSNIDPLNTRGKQKTILKGIEEGIVEADEVKIAVGYATSNSLFKLDELTAKYSVKKITLICGMYRNGIPTDLKDAIKEVSKKWDKEQRGTIYLANDIAYHGKIYSFIKRGKVFRSIVGSANLTVLAPNAGSENQYEFAVTVDDNRQNQQISNFIDRLTTVCVKADKIDKFRVVQYVQPEDTIPTTVPYKTAEDYHLNESYAETCRKNVIGKKIAIEIKAPKMSDLKNGKMNLLGSNINVCYAKSEKRKRQWYEAQLNISKKVEGVPRKKPFYIVDDEGNCLYAKRTSSEDKQLSVNGSDYELGKWLKGRIVGMKLVKPLDSPEEIKKDKESCKFEGVITQEILEKARMRYLVLQKTTLKKADEAKDDNGKPTNKELDVWYATFKA